MFSPNGLIFFRFIEIKKRNNGIYPDTVITPVDILFGWSEFQCFLWLMYREVKSLFLFLRVLLYLPGTLVHYGKTVQAGMLREKNFPISYIICERLKRNCVWRAAGLENHFERCARCIKYHFSNFDCLKFWTNTSILTIRSGGEPPQSRSVTNLLNARLWHHVYLLATSLSLQSCFTNDVVYLVIQFWIYLGINFQC